MRLYVIIASVYAVIVGSLLVPWRGGGVVVLVGGAVLVAGIVAGSLLFAKRMTTGANVVSFAFGLTPAFLWAAANGDVAAVASGLGAYAGAAWWMTAERRAWVGVAVAAAAVAANAANVAAFHFVRLSGEAIVANLIGGWQYVVLAAPWVLATPWAAERLSDTPWRRRAMALLPLLAVAAALPLCLSPGPVVYLTYAGRWAPAYGVAAALLAASSAGRRRSALWGLAALTVLLSVAAFLFASASAGVITFEAASRQGPPAYLGFR